MKKFLTIILIVLITALPLSAYCASVTPVEYEGNDANKHQYTPPVDSVRLTLPGSNKEGTFTYTLNDAGELDPNGTNIFTLTVGKAPGTNYTQVLSWSWQGTYELYAVIVKGGSAFNLYEYNGTATSDSNLVSPVNPSGHPANISHVSIIVYPAETPVPPEPTDNVCCIILAVLLLASILINILLIRRLCCDNNKNNICNIYCD